MADILSCTYILSTTVRVKFVFYLVFHRSMTKETMFEEFNLTM